MNADTIKGLKINMKAYINDGYVDELKSYFLRFFHTSSGCSNGSSSFMLPEVHVDLRPDFLLHACFGAGIKRCSFK
jgi:uncharacterized protein (DUF779 family)